LHGEYRGYQKQLTATAKELQLVKSYFSRASTIIIFTRVSITIAPCSPRDLLLVLCVFAVLISRVKQSMRKYFNFKIFRRNQS